VPTSSSRHQDLMTCTAAIPFCSSIPALSLVPTSTNVQQGTTCQAKLSILARRWGSTVPQIIPSEPIVLSDKPPDNFTAAYCSKHCPQGTPLKTGVSYHQPQHHHACHCSTKQRVRASTFDDADNRTSTGKTAAAMLPAPEAALLPALASIASAA